MIRLTFSKILVRTIFGIGCCFFNVNLSAQETDKSIQNSRASFLSREYSLTATESKSIVVFMDSTTQAMNKIYHDSTLTSQEKIKQLKTLEKMRRIKMKKVISSKSDIFLSPSQKRRGDY